MNEDDRFLFDNQIDIDRRLSKAENHIKGVIGTQTIIIDRLNNLEKKYDKADKDLWDFLKKVDDIEREIAELKAGDSEFLNQIIELKNNTMSLNHFHILRSEINELKYKIDIYQEYCDKFDLSLENYERTYTELNELKERVQALETYKQQLRAFDNFEKIEEVLRELINWIMKGQASLDEAELRSYNTKLFNGWLEKLEGTKEGDTVTVDLTTNKIINIDSGDEKSVNLKEGNALKDEQVGLIQATDSKAPEPCQHEHFVPRRDLSWYCVHCGYDTFKKPVTEPRENDTFQYPLGEFWEKDKYIVVKREDLQFMFSLYYGEGIRKREQMDRLERIKEEYGIE